MRRLTRAMLGVATLLAVGGVGAPQAHAQDGARGQLSQGAMDLRLFRPAIDSKGHLTVNGTDILGANDYSFGLILDGGFNLLPFRGFVHDDEASGDDEARRTTIVDDMFTGVLHFNYGIKNWAVVGVQLPVQVVNGPNVRVPGAYNDPPMGTAPQGVGYQGIGDITLHGKVRLLRRERYPLGIAGIVHLQLPSGKGKQFASEGGVAIWPEVVAEWMPIDEIRVSLNAGYRFQAGNGAEFPVDGVTDPGSADGNATMAQLVQDGTSLQYDDLITWGVGASFRIADPVDIVAEVYGSQVATEIGTEGSTSIEALGGFKFFVDENSYLMIGGGGGLPPSDGFQRADYRATLGFVFEPSIGDRDGDGYKDDNDECPDKPEDFDNFEDGDGCPDPDNDNDGILDVDDQCPMVPEDKDGDRDADGCPDKSGKRDRDGDGILDSEDDCPDQPEDFDDFEDKDGCPDPDNDQDGILDKNDLCPMEPEDFDDFEDEDGCPDRDNDNDRILDVDDKCPNKPETYNGTEDEDGCPDEGDVAVEENQIVNMKKIHFETDSAVIKPESYPILDAVAATLQGNPQIELVEVQGHADERGPDAYNIKLTRDRAASVVEALKERGVSPDRLRSAGYGERCPVDERSTPEAWRKNRRVEFKIIETKSGPTGVQVACPAGRELAPE